MAVDPGTLCPVCRREKEVLTSAFHGSGPPPLGRWAGLLDAVEPRFIVTTFPYLQTAHVCTWPSGSVTTTSGQYRLGTSTTARTRPLSVDKGMELKKPAGGFKESKPKPPASQVATRRDSGSVRRVAASVRRW
jgi:hypothetical protein